MKRENDAVHGLEINGHVTKEGDAEFSHDDFLTDFIEFVESKDMLFGGRTAPADANPEELLHQRSERLYSELKEYIELMAEHGQERLVYQSLLHKINELEEGRLADDAFPEDTSSDPD